MKKRILSILLCIAVIICMMPATALAYTTYNPIVTIVPANHDELEPIVKVGDSIGGGTVEEIKGAKIKVQCTMDGATGSTEQFKLPFAKDLWNISSYRMDKISWAGQGGSNKSEGAFAGLSSGGCSAYYYFKSVTPGGGQDGENYLWNFTLNYDANGGSGAPASQFYGTNDKYTKSYSFTIPEVTPTREGYTFIGWAKDKNAVEASHKPGGNYRMLQTVDGYNGGSVSETLYAVWQENQTQDEKYTVTYTDGVENEEVFADQVYTNLLSGTNTPEFDGIPSRTGYVFKGWAPEVADTVTETVTYVAQWKEDKNNNGVADDEEDKYTVTYTDGVENEEVFADQVYTNLLSGTNTPEFDGIPSRTGYVFKGWAPEVADTVTETVTYVAKWEEEQQPVTMAPVYVYTVKDGDESTMSEEPFFTGSAPITAKVNKWLTANVKDFPVIDGYTLEANKWYNKDSFGNTYSDDRTVNGWLNVYVNYTKNNTGGGDNPGGGGDNPGGGGDNPGGGGDNPGGGGNNPGGGGNPVTPINPPTPVTPADPATPTEPTIPTEPTVPAEPTEPATPDASGNTDAEKSEVPKTADANDLMLWAALLLAAGTGLAGTALRKRKADSGK